MSFHGFRSSGEIWVLVIGGVLVDCVLGARFWVSECRGCRFAGISLFGLFLLLQSATVLRNLGEFIFFVLGGPP